MGDLPFVVVHGAWLWTIGVAAGVLAGFTITRWLRGRGERAHAQAEVAKWTSRVSVPVLARAEGEIIVTGTLGGVSASTLTIEGAGAKPQEFHDHAGETWIDYRGDVLDLAGAVRVVRGTSAAIATKPPSATPKAIVTRLPGRARRYELVSVSPGDSVVVHGSLVPTQTAPVDRFGRRRWTLEPPPGKTEVEVIATVPRAGTPPLGWLGRLVLAGVLAAVSAGALYGLGAIARGRAEAADFPDGVEAQQPRLVPARLGLTDPLALAAMLPGSRDKALALLEHRFDRVYQHTQDSLDQRRQLARIIGGCAAEARVLRLVDRYDDMLAVAEACDDRASTQEAMLLLGRYGDAPASGDPYRDGVAAIATGRWTDAAKAAAAMRERSPKHAAYFACVEDLFRLRGGERDAAERLHAARDPVCRMIDAVAQPADKQPAALEAARADSAHGLEIDILAWAAGAEVVESQSGVALHEAIAIASPSDHGARAPLFAPIALATRRDRPGTRGFVVTHTWNAYYLMLRGDAAGAAREARLAGGDKPADGYPQIEAQAFAMALALRTQDKLPLPADAQAAKHPALVDAIAIRVGKPPPHALAAFPSGCETGGDDALAAAVAGDGAPLADFMTGCDVSWSATPALLGVLPRIDKGRSELAARIPYLHTLFGTSFNDVPFVIVRDAALHRDLAKLSGDPDGAKRWQALIDRHLAALADRDRLVALMIWKVL